MKRTDNKYSETTLRTFRTILFLISLFYNGNVFGRQTTDTIAIVHKQEKYFFSKVCSFSLSWDEVVISNKVSNDKINASIRTAVNSTKLTKEDSTLFCDSLMFFNQEFKVIYTKNNIVSCFQNHDIAIGPGYADGCGYRDFKTFNYSAATGEQINFYDLIDTNKIHSLDSFIYIKCGQLPKFHRKDFILNKNLDFYFGNNGLTIVFSYPNHNYAKIEMNFKELKPFADRNGLLKNYYANKN